MAVSLILKNSSVEDRHPTANQLTNGEISLNYNEAGAFLSCRDTNGDIQHIGGVKIDDATPGSPSKQALWFQPSTSKLFIYDGTGWLVVASGGGSGPGSDTVDQILSGNGIKSDPSTGLGVITLNADLNFSRGLEFVAGQIAIAIGAGLEFDANGRLANTAGAIQYRGTLDLTSSDPTPTNPDQGDTWINTADGTSNAVWNPDIPTGTTVGVGDLVIYNGTVWTLVARGLSPAERTDLGLGVVDAVSVEVTSSSGSNVQLPAATGTTAGVLTAADKLIIDEGASMWERNGSTLQPVDGTYDVEIGGGNIELNADGSITAAGNRYTLSTGGSINCQVNGPSVARYIRDGDIGNVGIEYGAAPYGVRAGLGNNGIFGIGANGVNLSAASGVELNANGNGRFTGNITIGGTVVPDAPGIRLGANGSSLFTGDLGIGTAITLNANGTIVATADATINNVTVGEGGGAVSTNTALGRDVLFTNTTGGYNVAVGRQALYLNTIGIGNVAVGFDALYNNTEGRNNTAVGHNALRANTTGAGNIMLGCSSSLGVYAPVFDPTTEDNRIVMGSSTVTDAYVQVAWTVTSDARDKTSFAPVPYGLDFVKQLQPTAYQFKAGTRGLRNPETDELIPVTAADELPSGPVRYGFKAQDILALEGDNPVIIDNEDPDHLRYRGEALVPVLVNAIKEQQVLIDALTARLDAAGA